MGMLGDFQTQSTIPGFILEQTSNELPNIGYALVYLMAIIAMIIFAQMLVDMLRYIKILNLLSSYLPENVMIKHSCS
jgi:hypothetical protein